MSKLDRQEVDNAVNQAAKEIGTRFDFRGVGASPPRHLQMEENLKPIEENGFIIADFTPDNITVRYFRFSYHKQAPEAIDTLEPFRVTELKRP